MKEAKLYKFSRPLVSGFTKIIFCPKIIGKENIPKEGRVILAGNHTNNFDCTLLMSSTKRCIHFLAKDELWKGLKKIIFEHMGLIPVNRRAKDHQALVLAEEYLKKEKVIGIFPEGTTEKEKGVLLPFKIGAVKMAKDTSTVIVPFAISGQYKIFSKNLKIVYGKPIRIKGDNLEQENETLKKIVNGLMKGGL